MLQVTDAESQLKLLAEQLETARPNLDFAMLTLSEMYSILGGTDARNGTLPRLVAEHYLPTAMLAVRRHGIAYEVSPGHYERLQPQARTTPSMTEEMLAEFQQQSETARFDVTNSAQSAVLNWMKLQDTALGKATTAPLVERYAALTELAAATHAFISHELGPNKADSAFRPQRY